jgi:hypothetical protein
MADISDGFLGVPEDSDDPLEWCREISRMINSNLLQGKTNNTGQLTLTANQTTTVITLDKGRLGANSTILWAPTTDNAAAEKDGMYESARSVENGTFTLTHANDSSTDRTFNYAIIG